MKLLKRLYLKYRLNSAQAEIYWLHREREKVERDIMVARMQKATLICALQDLDYPVRPSTYGARP